MVGDLAELAGLIAGKVLVRPGEVALDQLVEQAEEGVRPRAWEEGSLSPTPWTLACPSSFTPTRTTCGRRSPCSSALP